VAEAVVVGVVTRTGSAVAVALSGPADTPRFRARLEFGLSGPGLAVQPYHAAAGLDLPAAEQLIGQVGRGAERAAAAGLRSVGALLPGTSVGTYWVIRNSGGGCLAVVDVGGSGQATVT
jgi:hypothetical protein